MEAVDISRWISSEPNNKFIINLNKKMDLLDDAKPLSFNCCLITSKSTLNNWPNCSVAGKDPSCSKKKLIS